MRKSLLTASSASDVKCASTSSSLRNSVSTRSSSRHNRSLWLLSLGVVVYSWWLLLTDSILDFHSPIIDLSQVVVFNSASSRLGTGVDNSGSTNIGAEFVSVKSSVD